MILCEVVFFLLSFGWLMFRLYILYVYICVVIHLTILSCCCYYFGLLYSFCQCRLLALALLISFYSILKLSHLTGGDCIAMMYASILLFENKKFQLLLLFIFVFSFPSLLFLFILVFFSLLLLFTFVC